MSYNPFRFAKGYQERLEDFNNILSNNLRASDVHRRWSEYLELALEPLGWQAIWKIPREVCADLKIVCPCTVIVVVEQVSFIDHSCSVSITEVEDDTINLPDKMTDVPLTSLFPTMEQDSSSALSLYDTAQLIDCLRFFYTHLWMPWDIELDEDVIWVDAHLEGRLQLYFCMVEGKVPHELMRTIFMLVSDARRAQRDIEELQGAEGDVSPSVLLQLTELHNQLCHRGHQFAVYEKPDLLKAAIERHKSQPKESCESTVFVVLSTASSEQLLKLIDMSTQSTLKKSIRFIPLLQDALLNAPAGGCVWVSQGQHPVRDLGCLDGGGTITGMEPGVTVTDESERSSMLDLLSGQLSVSCLTVHMTTSWNIIKVHPRAECVLSEIQLKGSTMTDGVDVYPGATLRASNCHFTSCRTGVICYNNSTVTLTNCTFSNNHIALELREGCNFSMENCVISGSLLCAVQVSVSRPVPVLTDKPSIQHINSFPGMKASGTVCKDNSTDLQFHPGT